MTRSHLTYAERRIATAFTFDLGAGYPIGLAPEWAWAHYASDPRAHAKGQPEDAARRALNLRDQQMNIFATFSGSIALQRSLSAARAYLGQSHRRVVTVTTDPSIDIIPAIAREFSDAGVFRVRCGLLRTFSNEECERLCEMIYAKASDGQGVIAVITSPENPTGAVWSADHLRRISGTCTDTKSVLVVDHCFLMAGIHEPLSVTPIWDIVDGRAPVIAVWDTGKTVHLNGSKLGFIVSGNDELSSQVEDSLSIVQYCLPSHQSQWITNVLADPRFMDIVESLRTVTRENQRTLLNAVAAAGAEHFNATAGAFELIRINVHNSDNVGTVSLECFEESPRPGIGWRRIALARPQSIFNTAVAALLA